MHDEFEMPPQEPDFVIAPLDPANAEERTGVAERLALWKAQNKIEPEAPDLGISAEKPGATTLEERLKVYHAIYLGHLANLREGLPPSDAFSRNMVDQKQDFIERTLAESTPSEQEDLLIAVNNDWRAYLTKYGQNTSANELIVRFMMLADDILAGISEGLLIDPDTVNTYATLALREARDRFDAETVGPDTAAQGVLSDLAYQRFCAAKNRLEPLLQGATDDIHAFCMNMAETADAPAADNWRNMALRAKNTNS